MLKNYKTATTEHEIKRGTLLSTNLSNHSGPTSTKLVLAWRPGVARAPEENGGFFLAQVFHSPPLGRRQNAASFLG